MHENQGLLEKLLKDPDRNIDRIEDLIKEQCFYREGYFFSGFISIFADAMRFLGDKGRLHITNDNGARVVQADRFIE